MSNNRNNERSPIELAASFGVPEADNITQGTKLINYSKGGFCFLSDYPIKPKTKLQLVVDLKDDENVTIFVYVVWSKKDDTTNKFKIGVKAVDDNSPTSNKIQDFLDSLS